MERDRRLSEKEASDVDGSERRRRISLRARGGRDGFDEAHDLRALTGALPAARAGEEEPVQKAEDRRGGGEPVRRPGTQTALSAAGE